MRNKQYKSEPWEDTQSISIPNNENVFIFWYNRTSLRWHMTFKNTPVKSQGYPLKWGFNEKNLY